MADYNTAVEPVGEESLGAVIKTIQDAKNHLAILRQKAQDIKDDIAKEADRLDIISRERQAAVNEHRKDQNAIIDKKKKEVSYYTDIVKELTDKLHTFRNELFSVRSEKSTLDSSVHKLNIKLSELEKNYQSRLSTLMDIESKIAKEKDRLALLRDEVRAIADERLSLTSATIEFKNYTEDREQTILERERRLTAQEKTLVEKAKSIKLYSEANEIYIFESQLLVKQQLEKTMELKNEVEKSLKSIEADKSAIKLKTEEVRIKSLILQKKETEIARREKLLRDAGIKLGE